VSESPIEDYLDELTRALADRPPRELRGLLAEAEGHLHEDADTAVARGVPRRQAEAEAVARFGAASTIAAAERARARSSLAATLAQLVRQAVLLAGIGALAVGLSGALAGIVRVLGSDRTLVDIPPGQALSAADCSRWLSLSPTSADCRSAAVADWANETVFYRLAVGIVGLALLLAYAWLRRGARPSRIITTVRDAVGLTAFGLAAIATLALGINAAVTGTGAGQWLSATPVALAGATAFAVPLLRHLRSFELG
jgi:hypothetical protein